MSIHIKCGKCGTRMKGQDELSGKRVRCPKCGNPVTVPQMVERADTDAWYLINGSGRQFGPVRKEQLDRWLVQGQLTSDCRIRRAADDRWLAAAELYPVLRAADGNSALPHATRGNPRLPSVDTAVEKPSSVLVEPRIFWILFAAWLVCYLGSLIFSAQLVTSLMARQREAAGGALVCYCIFAAGAAIAFLLWLFLGWRLIQDGRVRTTPWRAVGFLFIPFFNLFWIFTAFPGLASDLNGYAVRKKYRVRWASSTLAWLHCVAALCCWIPYAGILFAVASTILMPAAMVSITLTASQIAALKKRHASTPVVADSGHVQNLGIQPASPLLNMSS